MASNSDLKEEIEFYMNKLDELRNKYAKERRVKLFEIDGGDAHRNRVEKLLDDESRRYDEIMKKVDCIKNKIKEIEGNQWTKD